MDDDKQVILDAVLELAREVHENAMRLGVKECGIAGSGRYSKYSHGEVYYRRCGDEPTTVKFVVSVEARDPPEEIFRPSYIRHLMKDWKKLYRTIERTARRRKRLADKFRPKPFFRIRPLVPWTYIVRLLIGLSIMLATSAWLGWVSMP